MSELRILLFGQPRLEVDGAARGIGRRKVTALLAYLAMASRPCARDELAELLYPRMARNRAYAGLRQSLSYLRTEIGDGLLEADWRTVSLMSARGVFLDVAEFRSHISRARGARELDHLRAAAELYRGAFLEGFYLADSPAFETWQSGRADELRGECASALTRLHDLYVQQGSFDRAVECARSIVGLDRLDEAAQRRLMLTLVAAGRKKDAIRQFETFEAQVRQELDTEPEEETRELLAEIRSGSTGARVGPYERGMQRKGSALAVLPFSNMSEDSEQGYFCDGLTDDLITALAAIPGLKVAARNTTFQLKGTSPDVRELGRDLAVSHVLEGSVRKADGRLRVNVQLIETEAGNHIWARKFDKDITDIFQIQDDIVRSIVTELDVQLADGEQSRQWRASTKNSEAYDLFLHARYSVISPEGLVRAVSLLDQALALDPDFAAALCYRGHFKIMQARLCWVRDTKGAFDGARRDYEAALRVDGDCADAHGGRAAILFLERRFQEAEKEYDRALSLGPIMEGTHLFCVAFYAWKKDYLKALWAARRARELSSAPISQAYAWEIVCLRLLGRLEEALAVSRHALELFPDGVDIVVNHARVCMLLKRQEELHASLKRLRELQPDFSAERWIAATGVWTKEEKDRYVAELHEAGFP